MSNAKDRKTESQSFTDGIRDPKGKLYKYTGRERLFVFHYLTDCEFNASASAKAAGYDCTTDVSFRNLAANILKKPHIKAAINDAFEALTMPKHEILFRLGRIAAGDIVDVLNVDNHFDMQHARDNGTSFLLKKVKISRTVREVKKTEIDVPDDADPEILETAIYDERIEYEIHDPLRALELLGKHSRLFVDRVESTGKDGRPLIPDNPATVVVYLPDNGRGDGEDDTSKGKAARTTGKARKAD